MVIKFCVLIEDSNTRCSSSVIVGIEYLFALLNCDIASFALCGKPTEGRQRALWCFKRWRMAGSGVGQKILFRVS